MKYRIRTWLCMAIALFMAFNMGRSVEYAFLYERSSERRAVMQEIREIQGLLEMNPVMAMR